MDYSSSQCSESISCKFSKTQNTSKWIYILTGISRFAGALVFIFFDLFAFVIANLIQTYIAFRGYHQNKKAGEDILYKGTTTN